MKDTQKLICFYLLNEINKAMCDQDTKRLHYINIIIAFLDALYGGLAEFIIYFNSTKI